MSQKKSPSIAFVVDERVSQQKAGLLTQALSLVRQHFDIEIIPGLGIDEGELVKRLQQKKLQLILLPLHRYQAWTQLDSFLGAIRTSGPTVAGYFCEPVPMFKLPELTNQNRRIILDFYTLTPQEILLLIRSLFHDTSRSGLRPLLESHTPIFCENWYGSQGQGSRIDFVLGTPEISLSDWIKRSSSIRIILSALWGLVYEEGTGRMNHGQVGGGSIARGYFQFAVYSECLLFRLCYYTVPHLTPKAALKQYWPNPTAPTNPAQLLLKYADFLRVHTIHETSDIEIVAGLFPSAPAEKHDGHLHTIWIEPLAARLVSEAPYEAPGPKSPQLRALPTLSVTNPKPRIVENPRSGLENSSVQALQKATEKMKELQEQIDNREETIRELRTGGVGTANMLPSADPEDLIEAFQKKYFEARFQIRQFEKQIEEIQKKGAGPEEIKELQLKMEALINREKSWIKSIMKTLEAYRQANRKPQKT